MIFYPKYAVDETRAWRFAGAGQGGRLVTVSADGFPSVGVFPFLLVPGGIEVHLAAGDEQLEHLAARPRCTFEVGEVLTYVPSYWEDEQSALGADLYHRTVVVEAEARLTQDRALLVDHLRRLLERHQPEGRYRPPTATDVEYVPPMGRLTLVKLAAVRLRTKFKLGQNRPADVRRHIADALRRRGGPGDLAAAEAVLEDVAARNGRGE